MSPPYVKHYKRKNRGGKTVNLRRGRHEGKVLSAISDVSLNNDIPVPDPSLNGVLTPPQVNPRSPTDHPDFAQIAIFKRTEMALKWKAQEYLDKGKEKGYLMTIMELYVQEIVRMKLEAEVYYPFETDDNVIIRRLEEIVAKEKEAVELNKKLIQMIQLTGIMD